MAICPQCDGQLHYDGPDGMETEFYVCDDCDYVTLSDPRDVADLELDDELDDE